MKIINKIFWQEDRVGLITNHLDAQTHRHWMLQLFLGIEDKVEITVNGSLVTCSCVVLDKNIPHSFSAREKVYYSALLEPTSNFAQQLNSKMNELGYWVCDRDGIEELRRRAGSLVTHANAEEYLRFTHLLENFLHLWATPRCYDERIIEFLYMLDTCTCDNHTVSNFADRVALSSSRFSHLFKEQVGIPLKSYILLHQMERAIQDLLAGKSVTDATMAAGFDSPSHFAGTVKRMMGMPVTASLKDSEFLKVY